MTTDKLLQTLQFLGIQKLRVRGSGREITGCCPYHGERNPSWGIRATEPHVFNCFSCGVKGSLSKLLVDLGGYSKTKAREYAEEEGGSSSSEFKLPKLKKTSSKIDFSTAISREDFMPYICDHSAVSYLESRGIPKYFTMAADVRWHEETNRVLFPWYFYDHLVGVTGRAVDNNNVKTLPFFGTRKGQWLYLPSREYHENSTWVLCEGEIDALKIYAAGFKNVAAIGSGSFTDAQKTLLSRLIGRARVALFFDNDEAGDRIANSVAKKMMRSSVLQKVLYASSSMKDPADMNFKEIRYHLLDPSRQKIVLNFS